MDHNNDLSTLDKLISEYWSLAGPDEHYLAAKRALHAIDAALQDLAQGLTWEVVPDGVYGDARAPGGVGWRVVDGMVGCAPMDAKRMFCGKLPEGWAMMRRPAPPQPADSEGE